MTQEKEALKLALEYMNEYYPSYAKQAAHHHRVNTAIKEALAQPEQIPPSAYSNTHQPEPPPECPMDSYGDGNVYRGQRSKDSVVKTITLAQQEPVAWLSKGGKGIWFHEPDASLNATPLYTTPSQRKPLTTEQILHFVDIHVGAPSMAYPLDNSDWIAFTRAIEAAHGIKE